MVEKEYPKVIVLLYYIERGVILKKLLFLILTVLFFLCIAFIYADEENDEALVTYGMGDQTFTINAGLFIPLFFQDMNWNVFPAKDHLSLGGTGSLEWNAFIKNNLKLGVEFGGMFAFSPNNTLFMIPVTGKITYIFRKYYPFEFPVSFGAGVNFSKLSESFYFGAILKPEVSGLWNYNSEWAFGLNIAYWWVPEIYFGESPPAEQSRFGNFLVTSLSALYHF